MATYNSAEEFSRALAEKLKAHEHALYMAASTTHATQLDRIFVEGKNSEGGQIGTYNSTKGMYANNDDSPKKITPRGKNGERVFMNGKPHVSTYYNSYEDYKAEQGRESNFVNLHLTGQLQSDYRAGFRQVSPAEYIAGVNNRLSADKIKGNEERYGKIFHLTKEERRLFDNTYQYELDNYKK